MTGERDPWWEQLTRDLRRQRAEERLQAFADAIPPPLWVFDPAEQLPPEDDYDHEDEDPDDDDPR